MSAIIYILIYKLCHFCFILNQLPMYVGKTRRNAIITIIIMQQNKPHLTKPDIDLLALHSSSWKKEEE